MARESEARRHKLSAINREGQCSVFVRNREQFGQPPFNLKIGEAFVARLTDFISTLALKALAEEALTSTA